MEELEAYIAQLESFYDGADIVIKEAVDNSKGQLLGAIKLRLFNTGLDARGDLIGNYSEYTKAKKKGKGQRTSFVTLRDTGAFYKNMTIEYTSGGYIEVDSNVDYKDKLIEMYSENILGLTRQELDWLIASKIDPAIENSLGDADITLDLL